MAHRVRRGTTIGLALAMFGAGYLCGSVSERQADAQVKELGGALMKEAGESGGALGAAAKLGTSITDMQEHVDGLQKNLEALKGIKAALGG